MPSTPRSPDERPDHPTGDDDRESAPGSPSANGSNGHGPHPQLKRPFPPLTGLGRDPASLDAWLARVEAEGTDLR